jgi:glycosyltransferase involved in cell wall biosynthesis
MLGLQMTVNFSLILPCYNEELNIIHLYEEFKNMPDKNVKELIFVNNGSTDQTEENIDKVIHQSNIDKNSNLIIKKLNLSKNQGYGGGIKAGLEVAQGDYIGWTHADLQTPLIDFLKLFNLIKDKKNIFGKGIRTNNRGYFSGIISRMHEILASKILGYNLKEINAQPKIFSKDVLKYFTNMPMNWTTLDTYAVYICLKNDIKITEMKVVFNNRIYGESKWQNNFSNFIKHIFFNLLYLVQLRFKKDK